MGECTPQSQKAVVGCDMRISTVEVVMGPDSSGFCVVVRCARITSRCLLSARRFLGGAVACLWLPDGHGCRECWVQGGCHGWGGNVVGVCPFFNVNASKLFLRSADCAFCSGWGFHASHAVLATKIDVLRLLQPCSSWHSVWEDVCGVPVRLGNL